MQAAIEKLREKEARAKEGVVKEYRETFCTPYFAASKQLIDAVIEPSRSGRSS